MRAADALGVSTGQAIGEAINATRDNNPETTAIQALNPFEQSSQLSPGNIWREIVYDNPDLTQQQREELAFLGYGPDAAPWDTWGALFDALTNNSRRDRLNRYGLDFDNSVQQLLDTLRDNESLGIPPSDIDDVQSFFELPPTDDQENDQSDVGENFDYGQIFNVPDYPDPPIPPEDPGYYNLIITLAPYSVERVNTGERSGGQWITEWQVKANGAPLEEQTIEGIANPSVTYDRSIIGIPQSENRFWVYSNGITVWARGEISSRIRTQEPIAPPAPTLYPDRVSLRIPLGIRYEYVEPPDWFDPTETACLAPQWLPEIQETVEAIKARVEALDSKIDTATSAIMERLGQMELALFNQIAAANGAKVEQRHDARRDAILAAIAGIDISALAREASLGDLQINIIPVKLVTSTNK